ncbi:response regulator [Silvibacterium sp.]|uniref:response regulator n=1 Tax=Silvibacterium sp. TaxID=1964179 RepID=UPI0039E48739
MSSTSETLTGTKIRILIVDDHPVVRAGLASMLATYPDMEVVGSAADGEQAVALLTAGEPAVDVVMMDLRMPKKNGIETLKALKQESCPARVVVITSYESDEDIYQAVKAGAQGYVLKASSDEEIIEAIRQVHAGERYLPQHIATRLAERMPRAHLEPLQTEILDLFAQGVAKDEIAERLSMQDREVWNQLNGIIEALARSEETNEDYAPGSARQRITIADVARKAGVSMSTVSRVLHNKGKHTDETRRAVMKVVKEYDFQLNGTAASLAMMRGGSQ